MVRDYGLKIAVLLMCVGLTAGIVGQIELLYPGILFMEPSFWVNLLTVHAWTTAISIVVICLGTISLIRKTESFAHWAVWIGFCIFPLLIGILLSVMLVNTNQPGGYLPDTTFVTASRHAYGTAALLLALAGLSAWARVKSKNLSIIVSSIFVALIATSGVAMSLLQSRQGLNGMPRRYIDYPQEFASLQFYSGIAAITCFSLSLMYLILLWLCPRKEIGEIEDVF